MIKPSKARKHEGSFFRVKDAFFDLTQGCFSCSRPFCWEHYPLYCCFVDRATALHWMIPMCDDLEKYRAVQGHEIGLYGHCLSAVFGDYQDTPVVFLIRDLFPVSGQFLQRADLPWLPPVKLGQDLKERIQHHFDILRTFYRKGEGGAMHDITRIEALMCPAGPGASR